MKFHRRILRVIGLPGIVEAVRLVVVGFSGFRSIDLKLRMVDAEAITVCVSMRKQTPQKHLVG